MADLFPNNNHDKADGPAYAEIGCPRCSMPCVPVEFSDYQTVVIGTKGAHQREVLYEGTCKCGATLAVLATWMVFKP